MEDVVFIKTAQIFIASIKYDVFALLGLNMNIGSIYISRKSSENVLTRMPPPVHRNKLLLTIFVSFEAIIPKSHIHVEKSAKRVTKEN